MPVPELITLGLTAHGAVGLVVLGGGLPRYSERGDVHAKAVQDNEELLGRVGQHVTKRLEESLKDVFEADPPTTTSKIILTAEAEAGSATYTERASNPLGSDTFREAIRSFMESDVESIVHYRAIWDAHESWCRWARRRRWGVYLLAVWEVLCVGALGVFGAIVGKSFTTLQVFLSFAPTGLLILWFFLTEFVLLKQQDVIDERRNRYKSI